MALLPLFAALNSFLTQGLNRAGWYRPIQEFIVPWQARMVAAAISPFGIDSRVTPGGPFSAFYMIKDGAGQYRLIYPGTVWAGRVSFFSSFPSWRALRVPIQRSPNFRQFSSAS